LNPAGALALKLVVTPVLIGAASLVGRRWGSALSGWLIGIPFTSAPIAFFLALDPGPAFATRAAAAIMAGAISQAVFCLAFAWTARRARWASSLIAGTVAFGVATLVLAIVVLPVAGAFVVVIIVLVVALFLMPAAPARPGRRASFPRWDLPARMVVATAFVADASVAVLRGLLLGLFAFACFFAVLATLLQGELWLAFAAAILVAALVHGTALVMGRRWGLA
jgi:hypothetical protein